MKLSYVKAILPHLEELKFLLPNGSFVPAHFHITEVGLINKDFIDCGGVVRSQKHINFQLWHANDLDHRLAPIKLLDIITLSEKILGDEDLNVFVEYQEDTIGQYDLAFNGEYFILLATKTACLAEDACGVPSKTVEVESNCSPNSGCC